jgi:hypothetical protein
VDKFLVVAKSGNSFTGPIMVTTSPRFTCPLSCAFRKHGHGPYDGLCYAEHGAIGGFLWSLLDRTEAGLKIMNGVRVQGLEELLYAIRSQPKNALWRHNVAGDFPSNDRKTVDRSALRAIVEANSGRRGFTFTHYDVLTNEANRNAIEEANRNGFTVNLSGNSLQHADELCDLGIGPVTTILPANACQNTTTPKGRRVVVCTNTTHGVTCAQCGLCARATRSTIVGFPATGGLKHRV